MDGTLNMQEKPLSWLKPAKYNPRKNLTPGDPEYEAIRRSIEAFDYVDPIIANKDGTIIGGHQRYRVLSDLGYENATVVIVDKTKDEEKALNIALNKATGDWDIRKLAELIGEIDMSDLDATLTGFNREQIEQLIGQIDTDWFADHERNDTDGQEDNDEYNDFLKKFELKKTTDDCYTPDNVFEAICDWVADEFKVKKDKFVRPFYPGGDYEGMEYKKDDIVVDNPPFSILSQIIRFYTDKKIKFFLFAPALTLITAQECDVCYIAADADITYENGATIRTGFITNMDPDNRLRTVPTLYQMVREQEEINRREMRRELPKYAYPNEVITPAIAMKFSHYGIDYRVGKNECVIISELDAQKEKGKAIYGKGLLLSEKAAAEKAAAEKAAAEKAAAEKWELSDRERAIVSQLGG